jgi:hypothetical protein
MIRLIRKTVILGLAAFGAYSLYEMLRPKAEQLASTTTSQLGSTMDTESSVATKVKDDVSAAKDEVVSDLKQGVDEQKDQLSGSADRIGQPVDTEAPQVGLG